jgi:hypothetical protein
MTSEGHSLLEDMGVTTESLWAYSKEYPNERTQWHPTRGSGASWGGITGSKVKVDKQGQLWYQCVRGIEDVLKRSRSKVKIQGHA